MSTNYKKVKEDTIKLYNSFSEIQKKISGNEKPCVSLSNRINDIRHDRFNIIVVGGTNSGRSAFINEYAGKAILPIECENFSSVIEIRCGKKYVLNATYADSSFEVYSDEKSIKQFLNENTHTNIVKTEILYPFENDEMCGIKIIDIPNEIMDGAVGEIIINGITQSNAIVLLNPVLSTKHEEFFKKLLEGRYADKINDKMFLIHTTGKNETDKDISNNQRKSELFHDNVKELSNCDEINDVVNNLRYRMLKEFDNQIWEELKKTEAEKSEELSKYNGLYSNCSVFCKVIENRKTYCEKNFKERLNVAVSDICCKYTNPDGLIKQKADELSESYEHDVSLSGNSIEELQYATLRWKDEFIKCQSELQKEIVKNCKKWFEFMFEKIPFETSMGVRFIGEETSIELKKEIAKDSKNWFDFVFDETKIPFTSMKPDFTEETMGAIIANEKINANVLCFDFDDCYHVHSKFSQAKHFKLVRDEFKNRLEIVKNEFVAMLNGFVINAINAIFTNLESYTEETLQKLDEILSNKQNKMKSYSEKISEIGKSSSLTEQAKYVVSKIEKELNGQETEPLDGEYQSMKESSQDIERAVRSELYYKTDALLELEKFLNGYALLKMERLLNGDAENYYEDDDIFGIDDDE